MRRMVLQWSLAQVLGVLIFELFFCFELAPTFAEASEPAYEIIPFQLTVSDQEYFVYVIRPSFSDKSRLASEPLAEVRYLTRAEDQAMQWSFRGSVIYPPKDFLWLESSSSEIEEWSQRTLDAAQLVYKKHLVRNAKVDPDDPRFYHSRFRDGRSAFILISRDSEVTSESIEAMIRFSYPGDESSPNPLPLQLHATDVQLNFDPAKNFEVFYDPENPSDKILPSYFSNQHRVVRGLQSGEVEMKSFYRSESATKTWSPFLFYVAELTGVATQGQRLSKETAEKIKNDQKLVTTHPEQAYPALIGDILTPENIFDESFFSDRVALELLAHTKIRADSETGRPMARINTPTADVRVLKEFEVPVEVLPHAVPSYIVAEAANEQLARLYIKWGFEVFDESKPSLLRISRQKWIDMVHRWITEGNSFYSKPKEDLVDVEALHEESMEAAAENIVVNWASNEASPRDETDPRIDPFYLKPLSGHACGKFLEKMAGAKVTTGQIVDANRKYWQPIKIIVEGSIK